MRQRLTLSLSIITLAGALLWATLAPAQETAATLGAADFQEIFREIAMDDAPWPQADLEARLAEAQPATLAISRPEYRYTVITPSPPNRLGRRSVAIAILVNGREEGRVKLNGDLLLYADIVCTTKKLDRHHLVSADDLTVVRREISGLDPSALRRPEDAIGRQIKTALQPGAILSRHQLEAPALVKRGDRVTIMAQTGDVLVSVPGEARDSGAAGEVVRVKNLMSRREITARVVESGLVQTEL
ncbi:MAG: flagellar basal body P-ring formation chaperone FlgA [Thermodesulfobacteriota bacterium]